MCVVPLIVYNYIKVELNAVAMSTILSMQASTPKFTLGWAHARLSGVFRVSCGNRLCSSIPTMVLQTNDVVKDVSASRVSFRGWVGGGGGGGGHSPPLAEVSPPPWKLGWQ